MRMEKLVLAIESLSRTKDSSLAPSTAIVSASSSMSMPSSSYAQPVTVTSFPPVLTAASASLPLRTVAATRLDMDESSLSLMVMTQFFMNDAFSILPSTVYALESPRRSLLPLS